MCKKCSWTQFHLQGCIHSTLTNNSDTVYSSPLQTGANCKPRLLPVLTTSIYKSEVPMTPSLFWIHSLFSCLPEPCILWLAETEENIPTSHKAKLPRHRTKGKPHLVAHCIHPSICTLTALANP